MIFMVIGKLLINNFHKNFTNFGFHISSVWEIEPNNLSLWRLALGWTLNICDSISKSTILKSNIATRGCFIEVIFMTKIV